MMKKYNYSLVAIIIIGSIFFKCGLDIVNNKWEKINSYDEYYHILEKNQKKILDKNTDFMYLGKFENNPCCEIVFDDIEVNIVDKE